MSRGALFWQLGALVLTFAVGHSSAIPTQGASSDVDALLDAGLYERAEVSARERLRTIQSSQGDNSLQAARATDVLVRALILNGKSGAAETLTLAQSALTNKVRSLGAQHPELSVSILNRCRTEIAAGAYVAAINSAQHAIRVLRSSVDPVPDAELSEALEQLGSALTEAGRFEEAIDTLDHALRIRQSQLPQSDLKIANTLERVGLVHQKRGNYEAAGLAIRQAERIYEQAHDQHPAHITTLNLLAQQYWFEGQLFQSRDVSERAVALAELTVRLDHPIVAQSLRYLAGTLTDLGDLPRSYTLKERALAIVQQNYGPDHYQTALILNSVALSELELGLYTAARKRFERVRSIMETRFGQQHDFVATALLNLALVDARLGDLASARREQIAATAIWEHVYGADHPFVAVGLTELASVLREQGAPQDALPLLYRALAIRQRALGVDHRDVARTRADLAATLMQLGSLARAEQLATDALRLWEKLGISDTPDYASTLNLAAQIRARRGDYSSAQGYFDRALQIRGKVFGRENPKYAETESGLSQALAELENYDVALEYATHAERVGRDHLQFLLRYLPERQALNYAAARPRGLNVLLSLARVVDSAVPIAIDAVIRNRALVLDEMAARQLPVSNSGSSAGANWSAWRSSQQRLANLIARGPANMTAAQYGKVIDETRRESETAERALAEQDANFRSGRKRAHVGLQEILGLLPHDAAVISFFRYDRLALNRSSKNRSVQSYGAFVLRRNVAPVIVAVGSAATIDRLVADWRADIAGPAQQASVSGKRGTPPARSSGSALRARIWDPLATHLESATRVFIVPDGLLNFVPFAALPIGTSSYLLESPWTIHYLTTERDLVPHDSSSFLNRGMLAIGDPSFDDVTAVAHQTSSTERTNAVRGYRQPCDFREASFRPLGSTLKEVQQLSSLWSRRANSGPDPATARVLIGRDATEATFKQDAHQYRVLHLATHGFFLGDCSPSATTTRSVGGLAKVARSSGVNDNPLQLSGLALAGANRRNLARANEEDGILTAEEVASLNLQGTEWAVLSACDTGLGEIKAGEGVFGLRRAFQIAGARTVIMSLWSVEDRSAMEWMRALYEGRLQKGLDTAEAVREASLTVLRQRRAKGLSTHPFYWAGFVASGDWR